jgi:hypothetical protein
MANLNKFDALSKAVLLRDDLHQSCDLPVPKSRNTIAEEPLASGLNNGLLTQSAEALGILASTATTVEENIQQLAQPRMPQCRMPQPFRQSGRFQKAMHLADLRGTIQKSTIHRND